MKNIYKIMFVMLIACAQSLIAVGPNKQQIFITNNYGKDIEIIINWMNKSLLDIPITWPILLKKGAQNQMFKAPYSKYHAYRITAYPKNAVSEIAEINSANDGNTFFVVEKVNNKSKPKIIGYESIEQYNLKKNSLATHDLVVRNKDYNDKLEDLIEKSESLID